MQQTETEESIKCVYIGLDLFQIVCFFNIKSKCVRSMSFTENLYQRAVS